MCVGNVGRRVVRYARALGMQVLQNDPPRARSEGNHGFSELAEVADADFVTLHVPLTRDSPDATRHLFDAHRLRRLRTGAVLVNTSRGAVVDNPALREALRAGALGGAVLDVWEGEPLPDPELIESVDIATPHIAGYSLDGKLAGTESVALAACRHFGVEPSWRAASGFPSPAAQIVLPAELDHEAAVRLAAHTAYDVLRDDSAMRTLLRLPVSDRAQAFDRLRREYPARREFHAHVIAGAAGGVETTLRALGFRA